MKVTPVTADDAAEYLRRLAVADGPPSVEQLFAIHRAHVERVPYETTWIHLGETWTVDPGAAVGRILHHRRGGYCFHLNGALGAVLRAHGYDVSVHAARMHNAPDQPARAVGDHAALLVRGLPTGANPTGRWYVDAGLGDGPYEPLPLVTGSYTQPPFTFELAADEDGAWHLRHDPRGSFLGTSVGAAPVPDLTLFAERHAHLSTSPESGFVRSVTAQRRDATGVDILRALTLTRMGVDGGTQRVVDDRGEWFGVLADVYGLHLADASPASRDRLWAHANAAHAAHLATPRG